MKIDVLPFDRHNLRDLPYKNVKQWAYARDFICSRDWEGQAYIAIFDDYDPKYGEQIIDWIFNHDREDIMWSYWTIGLIFFKGEALAIDFKLVFSDYV